MINASIPLIAEIPWFSFLLLVAFYVLLAAEFFLPTGGTAGFGAAAAIIAAIVIAVAADPRWAIAIVAFGLLTTPPLVAALIRIYPRTPIGRRILNRRREDPLAVAPAATTRSGRTLQSLVGQTGIAVSDLLPSGLARIDGEKVDAVSIGVPIDAGETIIVVGIENRHLQVKPHVPAAEPESAEADQMLSPPSLEGNLDSLADLE